MDFTSKYNPSSTNISGSFTWKSPSNIALVKYWGKKPVQIPANPSISFTLDACATKTKLSFSKRKKTTEPFDFELLFEGKNREDFKPKITKFLERIEKFMPFVRDFHFVIETSNSFPHSSGIASSASGMSALALCLMSIEKKMLPEMSDSYFKQKASFLARLGSGSASRSIEGGLVTWGLHEMLPDSSNDFASTYPFEIHPVFKNYHDTILLVDKGEKKVSSTVGHDLMHNHPFAASRFKQANDNLFKLKSVLKSGDLASFMAIVESEALSLHAMMMTSMPYFILMKPATMQIIEKIWEFRKKTGLPVCFTLDAGANVHVLYPETDYVKIYEFIKNELVAYCQNGHYICDRVGQGATLLTKE
ncbi:diphosphomevalonate decarboxylase [Ascidiimonas sp. W6]|uniref:diphosphomevalonate/mevalonate 3,5-bisphosphate decarboxylase family protein n=1 Tax=Ascidiimonas meishanensis TaxID=3128903 RepID=UPI0030EBA96D